MKQLTEIQKKLKAPKNQTNKFGGYKYRSCEDILEAVKPLIPVDCSLTISDDMVEVGGRVYVKAIVRFECGETIKEVSSFAREAETKKGMDDAQVTGSASSYARKYALNGMFLIDDTKDPDSGENKDDDKKKPKPKKKLTGRQLDQILDKIKNGGKDILTKTQENFDITGKQHEIILNAELNYSK
jgi:hypothetical protein